MAAPGKVGPTRPKYDWDAVFHYYVSLGSGRNYMPVVARYGMSERTVRRHANTYDWEERVRAIDAETRKQTEALLIRDRADRVADTLRIIDAARTRFAGQLRVASFRMNAADFVGLIKLEQLLEGQATSRVDVVDVWGEQLATLIRGILHDLGVPLTPETEAIVSRHFDMLGAAEETEDDEVDTA